MRALLVAAAIVVGLAAAVGAAFATTPRKPTLAVSGKQIRGSQFYRRETVRVRFMFGALRTDDVRTDSTGSFTDPLPVAYDPCVGPLVITATGLRGDRAKLVVAQRECPPPE
jgi:hypothetical protein